MSHPLNENPVILARQFPSAYPAAQSDNGFQTEQISHPSNILDTQSAQNFSVDTSNLAQSVSPPSWPQQAGGQWPTDSTDFSIPMDISTMIGDDVWADFGAYDMSTMPTNLGFFEYLPIPMAGTEDSTMSGGGNFGRTDAALTESVLNFRGSWDEGEHQVQ